MRVLTWYSRIIMRNISDTDGLSRQQRLQRAAAPVVLPVLEERFSVLLSRAFRRSGFASLYRFQALVVLLEIEQLDTHAAEDNTRHLSSVDEVAVAVDALAARMEDWRRRLEYACLGREPFTLLKDLSGQIAIHIEPSFTPSLRFYLLLLASIRLLQTRSEIYREEIYSSGTLDPSLAVIVAFLRNYKDIAAAFNTRWQSLPLFYLNEVLKVAPRQRRSGTTWFAFSKSPGGVNVTIPAGTCFAASSDEDAPAYRLLSDLQVTQMAVARMKMVVVEKNAGRYPEAALGYVTAVVQSDVPGHAYTPVPLGLCIQSPMLLLGEGRREVKVLFRLTSDSLTFLDDAVSRIARVQEISRDETLFKMLHDAFLLRVTTVTGEQPVENFHIRLEKGEGLRLTFLLGEDFPAVAPPEGEELPSLHLVMNTAAWLFPYSWARRMLIRSVRIEVNVTGLRDIHIYNELGKVDVRQPFVPFGTMGDKGAWLAFGSYEMACKPVCHVGFRFGWQHLPACYGGLKEYYRTYGAGIDNRSFAGRIDQLRNREWKPLDADDSFYLFRTSDRPVPEKEDLLVEKTRLRFSLSETAVLPFGREDAYRLGDVRSGFYRLVLTSPDMGFGEHEYRRLFAEVMIYNSRARRKKPLPEPPLSLLMDAPQLDYTACEECCFTVGSASAIRFSYICSLSGEAEALPDTSHPISLLEGPVDEGNLMIGIANAEGENLIRLYLELELLQREIDHSFLPCTDWYYRDAYRWVKIDPVHVLRDDTGGLMHSGAVMLQLPFCITSAMTDADGIFWLSVAVHTHLCNCSVVRGVRLNVAEAVPADEPADILSVPGLASYGQVAPLTGERPAESETEMRTRLGERIAHRRRLLLPCEFEQMTLEEFPGIDKVKCLPRVDAKQQGRSTVITLALLRSRRAGEYPLCTDELLCQVEDCLRRYASPFVEIDAINPVYEEVTVFCGISLKSGETAGTAIQEVYESLRECIAPWEKDEKGIPAFGYSFSLRDLQSRIKKSGRVGTIHGIKLLQVIRGNDGAYAYREYRSGDGEEQTVSPSVPWGILVPAVRQYVRVVPEGEWNQEIGFGDLEVGKTLIVKEGVLHTKKQ